MNRPDLFLKLLRRALLWLAVLLTGSAQAEWMALGRSDNFRVYLDQQLIKRNGDFSQLWQLMDFTVAQWADAQTVVWSIKTLIEYDCTAMRSRTLAGEAYSEQMGGGRMIASEPVSGAPWEAVEPGTTSDKIRQIACAKK